MSSASDPHAIQIVPYQPAYREAFERLNRAWLEGHALLEGKRGLITGIANDQSIAWGCAKAFRVADELGLPSLSMVTFTLLSPDCSAFL